MVEEKQNINKCISLDYENHCLETYITEQNQNYKDKNKQLNVQVYELINIINDLENTVEILKDNKVYKTFFLKNFMKLDKVRVNIIKCKTNILKTQQNALLQYKIRATKHLRVLEAVTILFISYFYDPLYNNILFPFLMVYLIFISFQESSLHNLRNAYIEDDIDILDELEKQVQKIEEERSDKIIN